MAKRKKKFSKGLTVFVAIVLFALGAVGGFFGCEHFTKPNDSDPLVTGDLEIHFPSLATNIRVTVPISRSVIPTC